jgi:hypothetical protein
LAPIFLLIAAWTIPFAVFRRYWRRTEPGQQWRQYAARLDVKVKRFGASIQWMALIFLAVMAMIVTLYLRHILHPAENLSDASGLAVALMAVSSYMISLYPARLLMNFTCSLMPSMRDAMNVAKIGLPAVTSRSGNLLLAAQAAIVIPICLVQSYYGVIIS